MKATITWSKEDTLLGWFRHRGAAPSGNEYVIEKQDYRAYSVWWGHHEIGEASSVAGGKKVAKSHFESLQPGWAS